MPDTVEFDKVRLVHVEVLDSQARGLRLVKDRLDLRIGGVGTLQVAVGSAVWARRKESHVFAPLLGVEPIPPSTATGFEPAFAILHGTEEGGRAVSTFARARRHGGVDGLIQTLHFSVVPDPEAPREDAAVDVPAEAISPSANAVKDPRSNFQFGVGLVAFAVVGGVMEVLQLPPPEGLDFPAAGYGIAFIVGINLALSGHWERRAARRRGDPRDN